MSTLVVDTLPGKSTATTITIGSTPVVSASANSLTIRGEGSAQTSVQQGLLKAWVRIDGDASDASIDDSFNCAGITDNGTGDYSVTRTNNMSSVDTYYVVDGQFVNSQNTNGVDYSNSTAALVRYKVFDSSATARDPVGYAVVGDLA